MKDSATALIWTVLVPLLPLFIVLIGYSNWRNICPLAFFSKISQNINWFNKRKVPQWFEENFYLLQFVLLFIAFTLRLVLLNFNASFLAWFIILTILASFVTNLIFTGKSWCNFFCPVGVVEKIYCLSDAKNMTSNSACSACSACKKNCPDIDMESNYWKEGANPKKAFAFYAFPGLVLGFYLYFYLLTGSFDFYYSGEWTKQILSPFSSGFFFVKDVPLIIAAPLTLALFSLLSFALFKGIEQYLWRKKIFPTITYETLVHRINVLSSFVAFNIFYIFAGAPSYANYPTLYSLFYFIVVFVSTMILFKEIYREEGFFIQERFALNIIKKWKSKTPIPTSLTEIYYTYANKNRDKKEKLTTYRDTILDLLQEGILTPTSLRVLDKLREQMGISEKEHTSILNKLRAKNEALFDISAENSSESIYQRESYKEMLEAALTQNAHINNTMIDSLRKQFNITQEMHADIMNEILYSNEKLQEDVIDIVKYMNNLRRIHKSIFNDHSREIGFLKYTIRNEFNNNAKKLFSLLDVVYKDHAKSLKKLKKSFKYKNIGKHIAIEHADLQFMNKKIADTIIELKKDFDTQKAFKNERDNKPLVQYLVEEFKSIPIATAALLYMIQHEEKVENTIDLERFLVAEESSVRDLANKILNHSNVLTTYEGMMYVRQVSLFDTVKFAELKKIVLAMSFDRYKKGDYLMYQGGIGDTLFVIISGKVEVLIDNKVINHLEENDYFGDIALLSDTKRIATVRAISETLEVVKLSKSAFKTFIKQNPDISMKLMKKIIERLIVTEKNRLVE